MSRAFCITGLCTLFVLLGCSPVVTHPMPIKRLELDDVDITTPPYRISPGDEVEIKFFSTPELNEIQHVRPDGKISLMFAQDIKAAGKTPESLAKLIKKKISHHIKHPDIVIIMHGLAGQKIYIGGEVTRPGSFLLTGRETVMQALADAGWMTPLADKEEVILVRRDPDGEEGVYPINVARMMSGEDLSENIIMQTGDLILVPPSRAIAFDRWIDSNIRQALPFSMNAGVVYTNQYQSGVIR